MSTGFGVLSSSCATVNKLKQSLIRPFEALDDPRVKRQPEHLLVDIVAIAILAVLSGANDMVAVETYGRAKQSWLETFLVLPNGIPSYDTFSRVLALLDPQQLHECFLSWVHQITEQLQLEIKLIHLDGKTARGSYDREQSLKALHTVSAWASEHHRQWAEIDVNYSERTESAHHRIEHRQVWAVPLTQVCDVPHQSKWRGLATVVMVKRERRLWNKTTTEVCFYITSLGAQATLLAQAIRAHWSIENSLHWVLDVTFREDQSRIRNGHGPENIGLLRRWSLNLLKREPSKQSLTQKRYRAAMDNDFVLRVLLGHESE